MHSKTKNKSTLSQAYANSHVCVRLIQYGEIDKGYCMCNNKRLHSDPGCISLLNCIEEMGKVSVANSLVPKSEAKMKALKSKLRFVIKEEKSGLDLKQN